MAQFEKKRGVITVPVRPPSIGMGLGPNAVALVVDIEQEANIAHLSPEEADALALDLVRGAAAARGIAAQQQIQVAMPKLPEPTRANGSSIKV